MIRILLLYVLVGLLWYGAFVAYYSIGEFVSLLFAIAGAYVLAETTVMHQDYKEN